MEALRKSQELESFPLFDPDTGSPSRKVIRRMGHYPMLKTLKVLEQPPKIVLEEHEGSFIQEVAADFFEGKRLIQLLNIKDRAKAEQIIRNALEEAIKEEVVEFNEYHLRTMGFYSLEKFSAEKQEMIKLIRQLCRVIIEDEELLNICILPSSEPERIAVSREVIRRAADKNEIAIKDEQMERCVFFFNHASSSCEEFQAVVSYRDFNDPYGEKEYARTLYSTLCEYADSHFQTIYLLRQLDWVVKFIHAFFPDIFRKFPVMVNFEYEPRFVLKNFRECIYGLVAAENASISFEKIWLLRIFTAHAVSGARDYERMETSYPWVSDQRVATCQFLRIVSDFVSLFHEYMHGVFSAITEKEAAKICKTSAQEWNKTAHAVLSEGFSVFMETIATKFIIENAESFGLSEREVESFEACRKIRIASNNDKRYVLGEAAKELEMLSNPWLRAQYLRDITIEMETLTDETLREGCKDWLKKSLERTTDENEKERLREELELCDDPEQRRGRMEYLQDERLNVTITKLREGRLQDLRSFLDSGNPALYIEGYGFFDCLYENLGLEAILKFVLELSDKKAFGLKRDSAEYKRLIKNPLEMAEYLVS
jgi:hypothetical protein